MESQVWNTVSLWQSKLLYTSPTISHLRVILGGSVQGRFVVSAAFAVLTSSCQQDCEVNGAKCVFGTLVSPFCAISLLGVSQPPVGHPGPS